MRAVQPRSCSLPAGQQLERHHTLKSACSAWSTWWQATDLARQMVTKFGMSDVLGQVSIDYDDNGRSLSSETRHVVEAEVQSCLCLCFFEQKCALQLMRHTS